MANTANIKMYSWVPKGRTSNRVLKGVAIGLILTLIYYIYVNYNHHSDNGSNTSNTCESKYPCKGANFDSLNKCMKSHGFKYIPETKSFERIGTFPPMNNQ